MNSDFRPPDRRSIDDDLGYRVVRTRCFFQWKKTLFTFDPGMRREIRAADPQIGFVMGAGYGPPYYWMAALPDGCRVLSQFSDLPQHRSGKFVWRFKQRWYRRVFDRSSLVLAVTQDTAAFLSGIDGARLDGKLRMTGLSFDPEDFRFGADEHCPPEVAALAEDRRFLVAIVTRVSPEKRLEKLFDGVESFLKRHPEAGLMMAGFQNNACSEVLGERVRSSPVSGQCCVLPVLGSRAINGLFARAQCSVWSQVSIGLQHSMASGCPVLLQAGWPADHILKEGESGFVYESPEEIESFLKKAMHHPWDREKVHGMVESFRSDRMLEGLLAEVIRN